MWFILNIFLKSLSCSPDRRGRSSVVPNLYSSVSLEYLSVFNSSFALPITNKYTHGVFPLEVLNASLMACIDAPLFSLLRAYASKDQT